LDKSLLALIQASAEMEMAEVSNTYGALGAQPDFKPA